MSPRTFLVHGLLAGLLAGVVAFVVAFTLGEPSVEEAIALEEAGAAAPAGSGTHVHDDGTTHTHGSSAEDGGTVVSRANQSTWGLLTGTVGVGVALGGLVALAAATALGRLGRLGPVASTALVTGVGFVAVTLVPFLKYPATPPAVGSGDTIGSRTSLYFTMLLLSVLAAGLAVALGRALWSRYGAWLAVVAAGGAYVLVVGLAGGLLPAVDELGAFPASTLWSFRLGSLLTLGALWATLGVALTGLVARSWSRESARQAVLLRRRELAASL